jgi:hypothetical protein
MKEYMLLIRNRPGHDSAWAPEKRQQFLKSCERYIGQLKIEGKLISAQPLVREGKIIAGKSGTWHELPLDETEEMQVGYYHVLAGTLEEAVEIAKRNPEFEFGDTARIEVRPVQTAEQTTGFVYPKT